MAKPTRKCKVCGEYFDIVKNDYVHYKGGFTEIECFRKDKLNKGIMKDIIEMELEELLKVALNEKKKKSNKELEETMKKIQAKNNELDRRKNLDNLSDYLCEVYYINGLSPYFYTKLAKANSGTLKGMKEGISYEDMLDMFKRKQSYLDKVAHRNKQLGKEMIGISRVSYDLAIIINKYDEYKQWKNKQKVLSSIANIEIEKENNDTKIDYSKFKTNKDTSNNGLDIGDILDDIY